jgi:hypothetical protein
VEYAHKGLFVVGLVYVPSLGTVDAFKHARKGSQLVTAIRLTESRASVIEQAGSLLNFREAWVVAHRVKESVIS